MEDQKNQLEYAAVPVGRFPESEGGINSCRCLAVAVALLCLTLAFPNSATLLIGGLLPPLGGVPFAIEGLLQAGRRRRTAVIGLILNLALTFTVGVFLAMDLGRRIQ